MTGTDAEIEAIIATSLAQPLLTIVAIDNDELAMAREERDRSVYRGKLDARTKEWQAMDDAFYNRLKQV